MAKLNSNLTDLYKNYKNQQNYNKNYNTSAKQKAADEEAIKELDVNNDGKITSSDQKEMKNEEKALLKEEQTYDFNNDKEINYKDLFFVSKGLDINGSGTVDAEEQAFIKKYQSQITTNILNAVKADKTLTLQDLLDFEKEVSKMSDSDKKTWKSAITKIENQIITNLKANTDLDKDGKATMDDLSKLWSDVKNIEDFKLFNGTKLSSVLNTLQSNITKKITKEKNINYDFNNDGKTDLKDVVSGDLNGDGKVTDLEKKFIKDNKSKITSQMLNEVKADKTITLQYLMNFENDISKLSEEEQKAWKAEIKKLENQMITNLKANTDLNKDGKADMKDLQKLWNDTANLKDKTLFNGKKLSSIENDLQKNITSKINKEKNMNYDFNNDKTVDINDILSSDLNKDGKVSDLESKFVKDNKSKISSEITKTIKADTDVTLEDLMKFEEKVSRMSFADQQTFKSQISSMETALINNIKKNFDLTEDGKNTTADLREFWKMTYNLDDKKLLNGSKLSKTISSIETAITNSVLKADKTIKKADITALKTSSIEELKKNGGVYDGNIDSLDPTQDVIGFIEFPTIPEEKGSYENGTLILYDTKTNEDGTTSKIWDIINNDKTETRTITQNFTSTGELLNTVVEDMDKDNGTLMDFYRATTFDANKTIVKRELEKWENLGDGYLTVTTGIDPDETHLNIDIKVEKIPLATSGSSDVEVEENPGNILLESLLELPQTTDLMFENFSLADLNSNYTYLDEDGVSFSRTEMEPVLFGTSFDISQFYLPAFHEPQTNENGLITKYNDFSIEYDSNNRISKITDSLYTYMYNRDENGKVNSVQYISQHPDGSLHTMEINIGENNNIKNIKYTDTDVNYNKSITIDKNLKIIDYNYTCEDYSETYDPDSKVLTHTFGNISSNNYVITKYAYSGDFLKNNTQDYNDNTMKIISLFSKSQDGSTAYTIYNSDGERIYSEQLNGDGTLFRKDGFNVNGDWIELDDCGFEKNSHYVSLNGNNTDWSVYDDFSKAVYSTNSLYGGITNWCWDECGNMTQSTYKVTYYYGDTRTTYVTWNVPVTPADYEWYTHYPDFDYEIVEPPAMPDFYIIKPDETVFEVPSEPLNIQKTVQTPLPEKWGKKPIESMTQAEMATEIEQYFDWLIANEVDEYYKRILNEYKNNYLLYPSKSILHDIRTKVAIIDVSEGTDGKSAATELDGSVGTYVTEKFTDDDYQTGITIDELLSDLTKLSATHWYDYNSDAMKQAIQAQQGQRESAAKNFLSKKYKDILNEKLNKNMNPDAKVDRFQQGNISDCWFVAAINTRKEEGLSDIVHLTNTGADITFKPCTIKIDEVNVTFTGSPIPVTTAEINAGTYNGKPLPAGDADVKAMTIALYKVLEQQSPPINEIGGASSVSAIKLLYGSFDNNLSLACELTWEAKNIFQIKQIDKLTGVEAYDKLDQIEWLAEYMQADLSAYNGKNAVGGTYPADMTNEAWTLMLEGKSKILKLSGQYNIQEIDKAVEICRTMSKNKKHTYVAVPTRDNDYAYICFNHQYAFESCNNGYVKLTNPWDNSVSFEIPELYYKLLFTNFVVAK